MREQVDNRYGVREILGSGGMAKVYLAHDEVLDRAVALEVLDERHSDDEEFVERFRREARSAAALSHPNIVSINDRGKAEDGSPYISMEYLPGGTLARRMAREGPMEPPVAAARQISEALAAAHEEGVIHRDVTPQNILVTRNGDVKVGDFGIARAESATTMTGDAILGAADYMSPEQGRGDPVDARTDLYSLGVVLYEMLTGALPFADGGRAGGEVAAALRRLDEPPPHPKELAPGVPDALDALVVRLLAKDPADRPQSATDALDELRRARSAAPKVPRQSEPEEHTPPTKVAPRGPETPPWAGGRGRVPRRTPWRTPRRWPEPGSLIPWALVVLFVLIVAVVLWYVLGLLGSPIP